MPTISDYLQQQVGAAVLVDSGVWVQLVNNATSVAYVSTAASDATGKYTHNAPTGFYTVYTGPTSSGPWTTTGDSQYVVATPLGLCSVTDYGAKADSGTTDNQPLFNLAAADAATEGFALYVPGGLGTYDMSLPFVQPRGVPVFGAGPYRSQVRNVSVLAGMQYATTWYHGTYTSNASGAYHEVGYQFNAAAWGATTLQMTAAADAGNFAGGDVIGVDGSTVASTANLPNEVNEVLSANAGTGVVTLKYGLGQDFSGGAGHIRKLNAGGVTDVFGNIAYMQVGGLLADIGIINTKTGYQGLHIAAYKSHFRNVYTSGDGPIAGNPIAHCQFWGVRMEYGTTGYQGAYYSHDNTFFRPHCVRAASTSTTQPGFFVQSAEGAHGHHIEEGYFEDGNSTSSTNIVALFADGSIRGGRIRGQLVGGSGLVGLGDRSDIVDVEVTTTGAGASNGISHGGKGGRIRGNRVLNTPVGKNAISLGVNSNTCDVDDNVLGFIGSQVAADTIFDQGTNNRKGPGNITFSFLPLAAADTPATITGVTTEQTIVSQSFAGGVVQTSMGWKVRLVGSTTGAAGSKTIRVKLNTTAILTLTPGNAINWSVDGEVFALNSNNGFAYTFVTFDGVTTAVVTGKTGAVTRTAATSISATGQLGNSGDSIVTNDYELTSLRNGATV